MLAYSHILKPIKIRGIKLWESHSIRLRNSHKPLNIDCLLLLLFIYLLNGLCPLYKNIINLMIYMYNNQESKLAVTCQISKEYIEINQYCVHLRIYLHILVN